MTAIVLEGQARENIGTKYAKVARKEGLVPCNLYGGGSDGISFVAPARGFVKMLSNPKFYTVDIQIDGKSHSAILKETQFHPVSDALLHADFLLLDKGRPVVAEIPVSFEGLAAGVKNGGKLMTKLRKLTVKTLPSKLVEHFDVDVTDLELGKSIKVKDLSFEGIEILNPGNNPVASVVIPRALRSAQSKGDGDASTPEGEEGAEEAAAE